MSTDSIQADENQIERKFNAATYFVDRHLDEGRGDKIAFIDANGEYSYRDLARRGAAGLINTGKAKERAKFFSKNSTDNTGGAHTKLTGKLPSTLICYRPDYSGKGTKASIIRLS